MKAKAPPDVDPDHVSGGWGRPVGDDEREPGSEGNGTGYPALSTAGVLLLGVLGLLWARATRRRRR